MVSSNAQHYNELRHAAINPAQIEQTGSRLSAARNAALVSTNIAELRLRRKRDVFHQQWPKLKRFGRIQEDSTRCIRRGCNDDADSISTKRAAPPPFAGEEKQQHSPQSPR